MTASVEMIYDGTYGRLASLVNRDKTGATMTSFSYTYNLDGYVTEVERENGDTITYQYDGVGRLMDEWRRTSGAVLVYRNRFQYDAVGNRTSWLAQTPGDATTYNYTYNTLNQLTQRYWTKASVNYTEDYTYDLNGNLTQKDEKTATVLQLRWEYGWDDEDRLISVVKKNGALTVLLTVEYAYCPACGGNRTQKRVWNGTKTDQNLVKWLQYETEGLNQLRVDEKWESQTDGNNYLDALDPWRTVRVSYNGPGQISQLMREDAYAYASQTTGTPSNVTTVYYNYDRMGVVAGLSNGAGSELEQFESDAFGSWDGKNTYTTRRITGKEYDEDVQLYFFHARWYMPPVARFITRDPLFFDGTTRNLNLYVAVDNNPASFVDTGGKSVAIAPAAPIIVEWVGGAAIATICSEAIIIAGVAYCSYKAGECVAEWVIEARRNRGGKGQEGQIDIPTVCYTVCAAATTVLNIQKWSSCNDWALWCLAKAELPDRDTKSLKQWCEKMRRSHPPKG